MIAQYLNYGGNLKNLKKQVDISKAFVWPSKVTVTLSLRLEKYCQCCEIVLAPLRKTATIIIILAALK